VTEREKVIKGLECCIAYDYKCNDCPYQDDGGAEDGCYSDELKADALALLKAQEPVLVKPYTEVEYGFKPKVKVGECPNCGRIVNEQCNYCSKCGQAVKCE
jgi:hypothetical protein